MGEVFRIEAGEGEAVDRIANPGGFARDRQRGGLHRLERPVVFPVRAMGDPLAKQGDLLGLELLAGLDRRHHVVLVGMGDAADQFALGGLAGDDGESAGLGGLEGVGLEVEAELGLALALVRAVAGEAVLGKDGADVAVEINRAGRGGRRGGGGKGGPEQQSKREREKYFQRRWRLHKAKQTTGNSGEI